MQSRGYFCGIIILVFRMVIFFTCSKSAKRYMQSDFDVIVKSILSLGHELLSLEIQKYSDLINKGEASYKNKSGKMSLHNKYITKAISLSNAAIIEASSYSFKLGQEVQVALDKKIPVLLLSKTQDFSKKIQDTCLYTAMYTNQEDIKIEIEKFLKIVKKKHLSKRVGVFLHNKQINFLDWYVTKRDVDSNRSRVVRLALDKYMEEVKEYRHTTN